MTHQDQMEHISNVLSYVRKVKNIDRKLRYLAKHKSEDLMKILWYAYNPVISFNITGNDLESHEGTVSDYSECNEIFELFDASLYRSITEKDAMCGVVLSIKEMYSDEIYQMVKAVFNRDLGLGLQVDDINSVFGSRAWNKWFIHESYNEYDAKSINLAIRLTNTKQHKY